MVAQTRLKAPRIVLDTNCLVSALLFSEGRLAWLRHGGQTGRFVPLVCRETASELIRVLCYPKFKLDRDEQDALLADFLPHAETVTMTHPPKNVPHLRDPDDAVFVALAINAKADALVSGDKDLLALRGRHHGLPIMTPEEFSTWLASRTASKP